MKLRVFASVCLLACMEPRLIADTVTDWNEAALDAIRLSNTPPPAAARNLAILHAAIYDAVNGVARTHKSYAVKEHVDGPASKRAAAAAAGYDVLTSLYPVLQAKFDVLYQRSILVIEEGERKDRGIAWGRYAAASILQLRSNDGSGNVVEHVPGTRPGEWRPTLSFGGVIRPALMPQWGSVKPFAITSGAQFRPAAPPALNTLQYAGEVWLLHAVGGTVSRVRTREQTEIALFWGYGPNSSTPAGHWNQIAQAVAADRGNTLEENARLFALLNMAMADAAIVSWDCKFTYNYWRPITAIQEADTDGNWATRADPDWTPLLPTPPFPEYTSGHSSFSGAAAAVLIYFYGTDGVRFTVGSDDMPEIRRTYSRFTEAARESGMSRIYGGIHFMSANLNGLTTGAAVGDYVYRNTLQPQEQHTRNRASD